MKANKYKLKPTKEQREKIAIPFGCARFVFNDALAKKKQFWDSGAYRITRYELQSLLVGMKKDKGTEWLKKDATGCSFASVLLETESVPPEKLKHINMSGLLKNHKLAQHLLDLGWFDFTKKRQYKLKAEGITVSACGDFNVSRVRMNAQTSTKQEASFIVHRT